MIVGILQAGHPPEEIRARRGGYDAFFARLLAPHGARTRAWDVEGMEFPDGPADADAWLITGSKHGAYEDHPFIAPLEAFVREIRDSGRPLVGICFGHQVIAKALGGKVEKWRGGWQIGRQDYDLDGIGALPLHAWHQDQVTELPEGATVVGTSPGCSTAAIAYGPRIWTIQPHPEFDGEMIRDLADMRGGSMDIAPEMIAEARASAEAHIDPSAVAAHMARVLGGGA